MKSHEPLGRLPRLFGTPQALGTTGAKPNSRAGAAQAARQLVRFSPAHFGIRIKMKLRSTKNRSRSGIAIQSAGMQTKVRQRQKTVPLPKE